MFYLDFQVKATFVFIFQEFQCHKADVLAVCVNSDGHSVFAAGIDPTLVQFEYISASPDSDWKMWIKSTVRTQHTHDVRALALTADMVVSGGIHNSPIKR